MTKATHEQILAAIERRYPTDKGAFTIIHEAPEGTGYQSGRRADAIALSMWPSRGLYLEGFEIKMSTSDYRNEAKDPVKAHTFARFCTRWWIVAPTGVVPIEELPPNWGLYEVNSAGAMKAKMKAPELNPEPVPTKMWYAWVRKAAAINELSERKIRSEERQKAYKEDYHRKQLVEIKNQIQAFQTATGINPLYNWETERLSKALQLLSEDRDYSSAIRELDGVRRQLERTLGTLEVILDGEKDLTVT